MRQCLKMWPTIALILCFLWNIKRLEKSEKKINKLCKIEKKECLQAPKVIQQAKRDKEQRKVRCMIYDWLFGKCVCVPVYV